MKPFFPLVLCLFQSSFASTSSYLVENLAFPDDMPPEVGGLAFDGKGNLYACLRRGDIVVTKPGKDPHAIEWKIFATGLHNPMGMQWVGPGRLVVTQMAELTEVIDTDGDGVATVTSISPPHLESVEIITRPTPFAPMGKAVTTLRWAPLLTTVPPFSRPEANTRRRAEEGGFFRPTICVDG